MLNVAWSTKISKIKLSIMEINQAQIEVKNFTHRRQWDDAPSIDKFDHLHEELIEMSRLLRYKSKDERIIYVQENKNVFTKEIGDLFFGLCRLANQLGVNLEEGFLLTQEKIEKKYPEGENETNKVREGEPV